MNAEDAPRRLTRAEIVKRAGQASQSPEGTLSRVVGMLRSGKLRDTHLAVVREVLDEVEGQS